MIVFDRPFIIRIILESTVANDFPGVIVRIVNPEVVGQNNLEYNFVSAKDETLFTAQIYPSLAGLPTNVYLSPICITTNKMIAIAEQLDKKYCDEIEITLR